MGITSRLKKVKDTAARGVKVAGRLDNAGRAFKRELVRGVKEDLRDPNSEGSRFMRSPAGQYYLPSSVQKGLGFVAPTPGHTIKTQSRAIERPTPMNLAKAGFNVFEIATAPALVSGVARAPKAVAVAARSTAGRGVARTLASESGAARLGVAKGRKTATEVAERTKASAAAAADAAADTGSRLAKVPDEALREAVNQGSKSARRELAARVASRASSPGTARTAAKAPVSNALTIARTDKGVITVNGASYSDIISGAAKVPGLTASRASAQDFRTAFREVNSGKVASSTINLGTVAASPVSKVEVAAAKAGGKLGVNKAATAEVRAELAAKAPKKAGKVTTRAMSAADEASFGKPKVIDDNDSFISIEGGKPPKAAPASATTSPARASATLKNEAAKIGPKVKETAKSRVRQKYRGKKSQSELDSAFEEAIKVADNADAPVEKAAAVASRAVKAKAAPAAKKVAAPLSGKTKGEKAAFRRGLETMAGMADSVIDEGKTAAKVTNKSRGKGFAKAHAQRAAKQSAFSKVRGTKAAKAAGKSFGIAKAAAIPASFVAGAYAARGFQTASGRAGGGGSSSSAFAGRSDQKELEAIQKVADKHGEAGLQALVLGKSASGPQLAYPDTKEGKRKKKTQEETLRGNVKRALETLKKKK